MPMLLILFLHCPRGAPQGGSEDVKRLILALEQYIIFNIAPELNFIKAVNAYASIGGSTINFYKIVNGVSIPRKSITCYVYVNNILVYQANSVISLSKIIYISVNRLFVNIRQGKLIHGKFTVSRQGPLMIILLLIL